MNMDMDMNTNTSLSELSNDTAEIFEVIQPYAPSLSSIIRNLIHRPSDRCLLIAAQREAMRLKHKERMKILKIVFELANNDKLTDEMFRLFMIAFAG
ncbi:hypothetical protein IMSAGC005_00045 [Lachnospiraceae bacterium]|nr:hypothetical protein IMSAGC005_00045 [Lachnospiraceae bacterium]